jgi:hypothetical protein
MKSDVNEAKQVTRATGPVTPEGKAIVSKNALKHGLLSKEVMIPGENPKRLAQIRRDLVVAVVPEGALESVLVDRVVSTLWRMRRIIKIESDLMGKEEWYSDSKKSIGDKFRDDSKTGNAYLKLMRYENSLQRGLYRALHELVRLQMMRLGKQVPAPTTLAVDLNK